MLLQTIVVMIIISGLFLASFFLLWNPEIAFAFFLFSYVIEGGKQQGLLNLTIFLFFISFLGFLRFAIKNKLFFFSLKLADLLLFLFIIVLFIGNLLVPDIYIGLIKFTRFVITVVFPYFIVRFFFKTSRQIRSFLFAIFGLSVVTALTLVIIQFFSHFGGRMGLFEANPIPVATLLVMGLVIAIINTTSSLLGSSKKSKFFSFAAIIICLYGIFVTGSRGPLFSAIFGLLVYFLFFIIWRPKVLVAAGVFLLLLFMPYYCNLIKVPPNIDRYKIKSIAYDLSTYERIVRYKASLTLFAQKPLWGIGTSGFNQYTQLGYPHNIFLEIASENGLIGLSIFIALIISVFWAAFRYFFFVRLDQSKTTIGLTVFVLFITLLIEKQFSYSLTMNKDLFSFMGLIVNLSSINKSGHVYFKREYKLST